MGSKSSKSTEESHHQQCHAIVCTVPQCNQPAVRIGPYTRRPLCRRHLLAMCREQGQGPSTARPLAETLSMQHESQEKLTSTGGDSSSLALPKHVNDMEAAKDKPAMQIPDSASSVIQLDSLVHWVTACTNTAEFLGSRSGFVVPLALAGEGSVTLPNPLVFLALTSKTIDHLVAVSVDGGGRKFRCRCLRVNYQRQIHGLLCHEQQLFIAQGHAVTVTDLSGRFLYEIASSILSASQEVGIEQIGANRSVLFVSGSGKMAVFSKATGQLLQLETSASGGAPLLPGNPQTTSDEPLLIIDPNWKQANTLSLATGQPAVSYPNSDKTAGGFRQFDRAACAVGDSSGRVFISDCQSGCVYAFSGHGDLLKTIRGVGLPRGLGVVPRVGDGGEKLLVADWSNRQLLVFDL